MRLSELKAAVDECVDRAGTADPDVEVWFKKSMYRIFRIGQFSVVPTVTIEIGQKEMELE